MDHEGVVRRRPGLVRWTCLLLGVGILWAASARTADDRLPDEELLEFLGSFPLEQTGTADGYEFLESLGDVARRPDDRPAAPPAGGEDHDPPR